MEKQEGAALDEGHDDTTITLPPRPVVEKGC